MAKSAESRKLLAALDGELAAASARRGEALTWTAAEAAILGLITSVVDRKAALHREWTRCDDPKLRIKLSAELRLLEGQQARLLKQISTDLAITAPLSATSRKAQMAARARWDRVRDASA